MGLGLYHAYLQIGKSYDDWTVGWAGHGAYSEKSKADLFADAYRNCEKMKKNNSGKLPDGTDCKCATPGQIKECLKNPANYPANDPFHLIGRNCGCWAKNLASRCCLSTNFRTQDDSVIFGPCLGFSND